MISDPLGAPYTPPTNGHLAGHHGGNIQADVVEFVDDGYVCWDVSDEREPSHPVKAGMRVWIYGFSEKPDGQYTHELFSKTTPITTNCRLRVVYQSWDCGYDTPLYALSHDDIAPNYT